MANHGQFLSHFQNFYFSSTKDIYSLAVKASLPTLQFDILRKVLDNLPLTTDDGIKLRKLMIETGTLDVILNCLSIFTHSNPESDAELTNNSNNYNKGSGTTSLNAEQAILKQKYEDEHIMILFEVLTSYINPGDRCVKLDPEEFDFPQTFVDILKKSCLVPVLCSYLRNDSVLDIMKKFQFYNTILNLLRAMTTSKSLSNLLIFKQELDSMTIESLINNMQFCIQNYVSHLSKTNCKDVSLDWFRGNFTLTYNYIKDATSLISNPKLCEQVKIAERSMSLEEKYLEVMKTLQFDCYEMIEDTQYGFIFKVPYSFEMLIRLNGNVGQSGRYKRLAQESATLSTCLPLSFNSSIFIRQDSDRLDVMKCLITGPSKTPYANGCFEFDAYFPPQYPIVPVAMTYKTVTGNAIQLQYNINPNLYNNGLICLSILNTWEGSPESRWNPLKSTLMEVLIAIQTSVFVSEPYFNEPAYEKLRGTEKGILESQLYTCKTYILSLKYAIMQQILNPSPCFKDVILTHFLLKRNDICKQVQNWIEDVKAFAQDSERADEFMAISESLKGQYKELKQMLSQLPVPENLKDFKNKFVA